MGKDKAKKRPSKTQIYAAASPGGRKKRPRVAPRHADMLYYTEEDVIEDATRWNESNL